ncbi:MAG: cache domain-containing protein [bacterium]
MQPRLFFNNFQMRVQLLFLLVALVPLCIVAVFSIRTAEELIINMASNQLENVTDDKASLLERWISERKADLKVVAGSSILKSMDAPQIDLYLRLVGENYQVYNGFVVVSREGEVIFDSIGKQLDYLWEECYKKSFTEGLHISNIFLSPEGKKSFFYISAPIFGDNDKIKGVVLAAVSTQTILSIILRISLGQTGECYLVDKEGTFLAHKEPRRIMTENIAQSESFKNIFNNMNNRRIYSDYRDIEVLGASRKIPGTDWFLVVEQDRDEAFMSVDRLKRYVYLLIIFVVCAAIVLAWLLSYCVVHPIRRLSEAARTLARGEFEKSIIKSNRRDEIGVLYSAFENMAKQLQKRQHSLEEKMGLTEAELKEIDLELKKTQLAVARSEQLAVLGRLAAGVTHEIRTPLTSLKLFLESIQNEIEISPEYEEDLQIGLNQIRRMEATINRFLDFAKPQEPKLSTINIKHLIEEALLVIKPRAHQQETLVEVKVDNQLPVIKGDRKQLAEALLNLMVNSLESVRNRGKLTITGSLDRCEIAGNLPCKCIRIEVLDTGPGIADENIPRLFEPFFTTKASGAGLGLSIVYSTIQMHGGDIKVKNLIGGGIAFSIFLPTSR